jgi:hypothetical protein
MSFCLLMLFQIRKYAEVCAHALTLEHSRACHPWRVYVRIPMYIVFWLQTCALRVSPVETRLTVYRRYHIRPKGHNVQVTPHIFGVGGFVRARF